jgi:hypothetical protein
MRRLPVVGAVTTVDRVVAKDGVKRSLMGVTTARVIA